MKAFVMYIYENIYENAFINIYESILMRTKHIRTLLVWDYN